MLHLALFGMQELLIILAIALVLFGAKKLPELARSMGSSVTQFKQGLKDEPPQLSESDGAKATGGESKD